MTVIDGLTNTWNFKDRLVAVENSQMRAQYIYDYSDRRTTKNVAYKPGTTNLDTHLTTLYIDKYFEVREHDAPTKFIWNGNTRVARVTGSFSGNQRVQRVRVWPGMNLVSIAVNGAMLPANTNLIAVFAWKASSLSWQSVSSGATVSAGNVLWLQANTNATLTFTGSYSDPTNYATAAGPGYLPGSGLEALTLSTLNLPLSTNNWRYDGQNQVWHTALTVPVTHFNSLPPVVAPGEVLFVRADGASQMTMPDPTLRIRYYHHNHLSSTSAQTDANGNVIEDNADYPFGAPRNQFKPRGISEHYHFEQKEKDDESQLSYFEARYLCGNLARFTTVDPVFLTVRNQILTNPQGWNMFASFNNRPLNTTDRSGCDSTLLLDSTEEVETSASSEFDVSQEGEQSCSKNQLPDYSNLNQFAGQNQNQTFDVDRAIDTARNNSQYQLWPGTGEGNRSAVATKDPHVSGKTCSASSSIAIASGLGTDANNVRSGSANGLGPSLERQGFIPMGDIPESEMQRGDVAIIQHGENGHAALSYGECNVEGSAVSDFIQRNGVDPYNGTKLDELNYQVYRHISQFGN